jgi:hypothetical protein
MLVANRSSLRGDDESDLAHHVRECSECRALAQGIESDTALLASTLPADTTTARVAAVADRRRAWSALVIASLPVAATIVFMVLRRSEGRADRQVANVRTGAGRVAMNTVSVDVARGQTATVIRTKDPTVTIVWISPGGTG